MDIQFRCDTNWTIPDSAINRLVPNAYNVSCFGCGAILHCQITKDGKLKRGAPNMAPTIHAYKDGKKLPECD